MIYFKERFLLANFLRDNLLNNEKLKEYFISKISVTTNVPVSVDYLTIADTAIKELVDFGFLYEIKSASRSTENILRVNIDDSGYVLFWSEFQNQLKSDLPLINPIKEKKLLSVNQACEFLSISKPTLYKIINNGILPFVDFMGQKRIQLLDLLEFVNLNKKTITN